MKCKRLRHVAKHCDRIYRYPMCDKNRECGKRHVECAEGRGNVAREKLKCVNCKKCGRPTIYKCREAHCKQWEINLKHRKSRKEGIK